MRVSFARNRRNLNDNRIDAVVDGPPQEEWRPVVGYDGYYEVSSLGRVKSVGNRKGSWKTPHILKTQDNGKGYKVVCLHRDGGYSFKTVHRLVAVAFIPNQENRSDVNHIDGDKSNNVVWNLEWATKSENAIHARDVLGKLYFNRRLTDEQVIAIRSDDRPEHVVGEEYGLSQTAINAIRTGRTYKSVSGKTGRVGRSRQRKLTDRQVAEIRASSKKGVELAREYGVAASTICKIRKHQRYKVNQEEQ